MTSSKETSNDVAQHFRVALESEQQPASNLIPFDRWLESINKTAATGWRWRQRGWIVTVNICGRVYLSRDEIKRFEQRAIAGEFSQPHATPHRKPANDAQMMRESA